MLIRLPDARPRQVDDLVSLVDLQRTLLHLAGVPVPMNLPQDGLLDGWEVREPETRPIIAEWARAPGKPEYSEDPLGKEPRVPRIWALRTADFKYIYNPALHRAWNNPHHPFKTPDLGFVYEERELYDIKQDPTETRNLVSERPDVIAALEHTVREWIAAHRPVGVDPPDTEVIEALRALGYGVPAEAEGD